MSLTKGWQYINRLINRLAPSGSHINGDQLFLFGYQKWFDYEANGLISLFTHGLLIFWMYPLFGMKISTYFPGVSEWLFGPLLLVGFWNKKLGILGALGSVVTFLCTVTIIPFMPDGWKPTPGA